MNYTKKTHTDFLNDIIIPIEQNKTGSKNLFVLVEARLELDNSDYREEDVFLRQERHWSSFPTDSNPGNWIEHKKIRLETISGMVPNILDMPVGCKFCTRCDLVEDRCHTEEPELLEMMTYHFLFLPLQLRVMKETPMIHL